MSREMKKGRCDSGTRIDTVRVEDADRSLLQGASFNSLRNRLSSAGPGNSRQFLLALPK